jgi:hypothetical protein
MKAAKPWIVGGAVLLMAIGIPLVATDLAREVGSKRL